MWFTETSWPPIVLITLAAVACGWMWYERRQSWWIVGTIVCVALIVGVMVFERSIVTPREQIEKHILDLTQAFADRNEDETLSFVSPQAEHVRQQVKLGFATVTKIDNLRISDVDVTLLADGSRARSRFRANGTVEVTGFGNVGHKPSQWMLTWRQEGGIWKIVDVERLDTITGEPLDLLDHRQ